MVIKLSRNSDKNGVFSFSVLTIASFLQPPCHSIFIPLDFDIYLFPVKTTPKSMIKLFINLFGDSPVPKNS